MTSQERDEPEISVNGARLTQAQAMAVRVAIGAFIFDLQEQWDTLGKGEHAAEIRAAYLARLGEVVSIMAQRNRDGATADRAAPRRYRVKDHERVPVLSMGKALRILAWATTDEDANDLMQRNDRLAVVATLGPLALLADKYDKGAPR